MTRKPSATFREVAQLERIAMDEAILAMAESAPSVEAVYESRSGTCPICRRGDVFVRDGLLDRHLRLRADGNPGHEQCPGEGTRPTQYAVLDYEAAGWAGAMTLLVWARRIAHVESGVGT